MAAQVDEKKVKTGSSEMWMLQWVLKAELMQGVGLPLPMPHELQYFAPITQAFPLTSPPAHLYRCVVMISFSLYICSSQKNYKIQNKIFIDF